jgi:crotonobetainyl-CoA:carnitine CoA-transferase CaiB-like acyl-CoA transferase
MPGLKPVTGETWEPRFDPVPSFGEHTAQILAEFDAVQESGKDTT